MKKNLFEDIAEQLNDYHSPMDLSGEWQAVKAAQQKEKRKRRVVGWAIILLLLLGTGAGYLANTIGPVSSSPQREPVQVQAPAAYPQVNIDKKATKIEQYQTITASAKSKVEETTVLTPINDETEIIESKNLISTIEATRNDNEIASTIESQTRVESTTTLPPKSIVRQAVIALIPTLPVPLLATPEKTITPIVDISAETINPSNHVQLFFNAGLAYTKQQLSAKQASADTYRELRSMYETPLETYTYDIGVNIPMGKKSFLSLAGHHEIGFDQLKFNYETPSTYHLENVLLKRITNRFTGEVENVYGDTTVIGSQTVSGTQYNRYTTTSLSASWGYQIFNWKRINVALSGGALYNIALRTKGQTIDNESTNGTLVPLRAYKQSHGFGLIANAQLNYRLGPKLHFGIQASGSYFLSSATIESAVLNSNFYRIGAAAGLRYAF